MASEVLVVFCTFPSAEQADSAASALVDERLCACANLLPAIQSIYRWKGEVQRDAEVLTLFKTTAAGYPALERRLRALHPYECPEIVALPVDRGLPDYLAWVREAVSPAT